MQASNPYQAPSAPVADQGVEEYAPVKVFGASGRIGRVRYIGYSVAFALLFCVLVIAGIILGPVLGADIVTFAVAVLAIVGLTLTQLLLTIQRCHDFNGSGWLSFLTLVPLVALIFWIVPGTRGANRFGPPTPPNTAGAIALALIVPSIFVLGILAAIALPAYQQYAMRAQAFVRV